MSEFQLVVRDGVDTLHRWPALEQCNLDDTDEEIRIKTLSEIETTDYQFCEHCFPLPLELGS